MTAAKTNVLEIENYMATHRKRAPRMPPLVTNTVAALKAAEAKQLEAGLNTPDGAQAELHRAMAVALDFAAQVVLAEFDALSRKPSL